MANEIVIPIPARLKNVAKGGHVAGAQDIVDDALNKEQSVVNAERIADIARLDGEIDAVEQKVEDIGDAIQFDQEGDLVTVDGDDFQDPEARGKIPTIGGILDGADDVPTAGSDNLVKSGGVEGAFSDVTKGYTAIARCKGTTGTDYSFIKELNVPMGSIVKNLGSGKVLLYKEYDPSSQEFISVDGGESVIVPFNTTWLRGRSSIDLPFDLLIYYDTKEIEKIWNSVQSKPIYNLIDPKDDNYIIGHYLLNGNLYANEDYDSTGYIKVKPDTNYSLTAKGEIPNPTTFSAYNSLREFTGEIVFSGSNGGTCVVITTGQDTCFIRINLKKSVATDYVFTEGVDRPFNTTYTPIDAYLRENGENTILPLLSSSDTLVEPYNVRTGTKFIGSAYGVAYEYTDIYEYGPFDAGTMLKINMSDVVFIRAYSVFNFGGIFEYVANTYAGSYCLYEVKEAYPYIKIMCKSNTIPTLYKSYAVKEDVKDIRNVMEEQFFYSSVEHVSYRVLTGYKLTSSYYALPEENTDIFCYGPFKGGTKLSGNLVKYSGSEVVAQCTHDANFTQDNILDITSSIEEDGSFSIVTSDNYPYLKLCVLTSTLPTVLMATTTKEQVEILSNNQGGIKNISQCISSLGSDTSKSNGILNDGDTIVLDDFPLHCRKGLALSFYGDITSFYKLIIGKGYKKYRGRWIEIDNTNVVFKQCESQGTERTVSTSAHGLSISTFIDVSISLNYAGKCQVVIMTLTGHYSWVFDWGYEGNYEAFVSSEGSILTNCIFNGTSTDFKLPVWIIGDSYMGVNNNRWPGQLKNIGYFNYLIDNLAGINSTGSFNDFLRLLNFGTPKYLVWMSFGNDYPNLQKAILNANKVANICDERGIELLLMTLGSFPERDFSVWNTYVRNSGRRFIDFEKAVGMPTFELGVDHWYGAGTAYAYLSNDKAHPTELGAKALAQRVLIDFPELMQYGLYKDDTSLDNTNNDQ